MCVSKAWSWFCLLPFAAGLSQSRFFCCTIRGVSISCPQPGRVLGPRLGGRRFFRPQHHPSPQPSLPVLGGLAVLFHTFSTKHLCFFTLVTSTPSRLGMGDGGGTILQGHWLHISGSCFFPMLFGDPLCVSSNGGDFQWQPWWPEPRCRWCGVRSVSCSPGPGASAH